VRAEIDLEKAPEAVANIQAQSTRHGPETMMPRGSGTSILGRDLRTARLPRVWSKSDAWAGSVEQLQALEAQLQEFGWKVCTDDVNEDLTIFSVVPGWTGSRRQKRKCLGLTTELPSEKPVNEKALNNQIRRPRAPIARNTFSGPSKFSLPEPSRPVTRSQKKRKLDETMSET
jgi:hypothetical protein